VPFTARKLSEWDQAGIHRGEAAGVDDDLVAENVALALPGQVEVGVVGQVHHRVLIGG